MSDGHISGDEYLCEITAFLITSAKRCMGPEYMYGAGRLVQTMVLLSRLPEHVPGLKENKLLVMAREFVEADQQWWAGDKLEKFIDEMSAELLHEMKKKLDRKMQ
ncbi:MAG: hypothetical protein JSV25_03975 [Spirochaetota bacterium]|nr:MAG: hypothetical protein JSV25_03975 [Spirochaetota bacterium]